MNLSPPDRPLPAASDRLTRILLVLAVVLPLLILAAHALLAPPMVSRDTVVGLQVWQNMRQGGGWNEVAVPDRSDIARNKEFFVTWWSPGQYLPAGWLGMAGLSLGTAVLLAALLSCWSLAAGLRQLHLALGGTPRAAAWTALAATATWHTLYAFGFFIGGEVALLAIWPWITLAVWRIRNRPGWQLVLLPPLFVAGSFAKLSFTLYAAGLLAFLWLEEMRAGPVTPGKFTKATARLGLVGALYLGFWYWLFLSRGDTPASGHAAGPAVATIAGFVLNAPWFSAVGGGSVLGRWFMLSGISPEAGLLRVTPGLLAIGAVALFCYARAAFAPQPLHRLAGAVCLTAALLLGGLLLRGADVSLEDRHLRPAGVLLLALGADVATRSPRKWQRTTAATVLALAGLFGTGAAVQRLFNIRRHALTLPNGTSITELDPAVLAALRQIDATPAGRLVYLPEPELALALPHTRFLTTDAVIRDRAWLAADVRRGRVPALQLVLPDGFDSDGRAAAIRASFSDYDPAGWTRIRTGAWDFWQAPAGLPQP